MSTDTNLLVKGIRSKWTFELNRRALEGLKAGNYKHALSCLHQALIHVNSLPEGPCKSNALSFTWNHLGCYYKRTREYGKALSYFYKALGTERNRSNTAGTHLNAGMVFCELGKHEKGLECALQGLALLKTLTEKRPKALNTLLSAYHCVGTEYQHLGMLNEAANCYKQGLMYENNRKAHVSAHLMLRRAHDLLVSRKPTEALPRGAQRRIFTQTRGERLFSFQESSRLQVPHYAPLELAPPMTMYTNSHKNQLFLSLRSIGNGKSLIDLLLVSREEGGKLMLLLIELKRTQLP